MADLLSYVLGVLLATKVVVALGIVALPYSMRSVFSALGRDERLGLFALPLIWNVHLILGFFNFVCAIPLALYGLALAVRLRADWSNRRAVLLAVVCLATFYTHVVPFGFLALGALAIAVGDSLDATMRRLLPLAPAALAAVWWARHNPAGGALSAVFLRNRNVLGPSPEFQSFRAALASPARWLTDVLRSGADEKLFVAWAVLMLLVVLAGMRSGPRADPKKVRWRLAILAPFALVLYFVTPVSYDWIWPINGRFPLLVCVFSGLLLPEPRPRFARLLYGAAGIVSAVGFLLVTTAFRSSERDELGDIDRRSARFPKDRRSLGSSGSTTLATSREARSFTPQRCIKRAAEAR